jgi:aldose 1-epimerase
MYKALYGSLLFLMLPLGGCQSSAVEQTEGAKMAQQAGVEKSGFGQTVDGKAVTMYTCVNRNGLVLKMIDYGATVVAVETPDRNGKKVNITLSFPNLEGYLQPNEPYFGATVGRYANRIGNAQFTLDGATYKLPANDGPNSLHGGTQGFDKRMWNAVTVENDEGVGVHFSRLSPDGEEGYPGNLQVDVVYLLTNQDELKIDYRAKTDKATPVNLTNHCYWNLGGAGSGSILNEVLMINADSYLPVDKGLIPTGKIAPVEGTPFDFLQPTPIGERIDQVPGGYDHCFVLRNQSGELALAARVRDPESGRVMEISTTQPGIQFYTGNFLNESAATGGFPQHGAFCLETQHFPNSPNEPSFPSTILMPGEEYHQVTVQHFYVEQ